MEERTVIGKCPQCGSDVYERSACFYCSAYKDKACDFTLWKDVLNKFQHSGIETEDAKQLLLGKTIVLHLVSPKKGSPFNCRGILSKYKEFRRWGVDFIFPQKKVRQETETRELEA